MWGEVRFKFGIVGGDEKILDKKLSSIYNKNSFYTTFYGGRPIFTNININGFNFYFSNNGYTNITQLTITNDNDDSTWPK
ncbi:hypothetical protein [Spiroplasma endosymbiont of Virgichneumon dumeticola]|uniref:hypothetical protein n=1 Tax=Spiroplasma endosymbiont of Virgichneumon dumeticola TaxID=3139323 RepID=UPI0035C8DEEE